MSEKILYQVVFNGQLTDEFDLETTQRKFASLFGLSPEKTKRIFSGKDFILKSRISEQAANDYAMKLLEIGCECYVELMPHADDISLEAGFVERRKLIRRHYFRRNPRAGVITPDRRSVPSRRKIDLFLLERDGNFPGNTIQKQSGKNGR